MINFARVPEESKEQIMEFYYFGNFEVLKVRSKQRNKQY